MVQLLNNLKHLTKKPILEVPKYFKLTMYVVIIRHPLIAFIRHSL